MPLQTDTIDLAEELDRLKQRRGEIADKVAEYDPSDAPPSLVDEGKDIDQFVSGIGMFRAEYETDQITLAALTNGERHLVADVASETGATGADQNAFVAVGTRDAPYLHHDPDSLSPSTVKETAVAVGDLPPGFVDWVQSQIANLGSMDGDTGKSFGELVREKRKQADSTETSG